MVNTIIVIIPSTASPGDLGSGIIGGGDEEEEEEE
jgi:hypothetical protein